MVSRNIKVLLLAALVSSLLFQGQGDWPAPKPPFCCYGTCIYPCMKNNIHRPRACHSSCASKCNIPNEMGVAVAAGGGNLGKGNDGTGTGGAAP